MCPPGADNGHPQGAPLRLDMRARADLLKLIIVGMVGTLAAMLLLVEAGVAATDLASHEGQQRSFEGPSDGYLCLCAVIRASKADDQVLNAVWRSFIEGGSNFCGARSDGNPPAPGCVLHVFTIFPASGVCPEHKLLNPGPASFPNRTGTVPPLLQPSAPHWCRRR